MNLPLNIDIQQILLHLLNFTILFCVLYFVLYVPIKNFMNKRTEYYKKLDDDANDKLKESEEIKAEYEKKLASAESEIAEIKANANKENALEREKVIAKANDEAKDIVEKAKEKANDEHKRIVADAQKEIADIVDEATRKIVLDSDVDTYDQFLNAVERNQ